MKFLRTVSTGRLLAMISAIVVATAGGTAIAVAATGSGPVPKREPLASAVHHALAAPDVKGISADISFTNNLIDSSDFAGQVADPILQGATGRLWVSNDGRLRIELQSENGDTQVVVNHRSFWISDPGQSTVYEGTLPAETSASASKSPATDRVPTIARIESEITRLTSRLDLSGAQPTDVAGQPAYRVTVSPKHDGGLLGSVALAWDAVRGVPLQIAVYTRGNSTPVLALKATHISYGTVPASDFNVAPPAGDKVIRLDAGGASDQTTPTHPGRAHGKESQITGAAAVAKRVPFKLNAPKTLVGLPRHRVGLMALGKTPAALITYGENLGGMAVIEQAAAPGAAQLQGGFDGLSLPTVSIDGAQGQELSTALGTMIHFTRGGVEYTVIGSVPATAAELAARGL